MKYLTVIFVILFVSLFSCSKSKNNKKVASTCPDSTGVISFSNQIVPIINASCGKNDSGCHSGSAPANNGNFNTYQGFISHPDYHIIHSVKQDDPATAMPMPASGSKISACDIAKITNWVNQGKKNN